MLQFLQPIWLWGSVAIVLPILIHLWNVKSGKTLRVGSIALFSEAAKAGSRKIRLTEWWLLLLRCLLLISLAVLLSKPVWLNKNEGKEKGWLLIPADEVREASQQQKSLIDSLLKAGFRFHYFDETFREGKIEEALQQTAPEKGDSRLNYWSLLKELNAVLPARTPVCLFSDNKLKHFAGLRPVVSFPLQWRIISDTDTASRWLRSAWQTGGDSLRVSTAKSVAKGTQYSWQDLAFTTADNDFIISGSKNKANITFRSQREAVTIDTSRLRIVVYAPQKPEDAAYVSAAIQAVQDVTKYEAAIQKVITSTAISSNYDWLFWLSDEPLPDSLKKNHVWMYERGKVKNSRSYMISSQPNSFETDPPVSIYQYIEDSGRLFPEQVIWQTSSGKPILTREKETPVFHFYSRFNPQWNDMVWSASFPQVMYDLVLGDRLKNESINDKDERLLDASQIMPLVSVNEGTNNRKKSNTQDMSKPMWLLVFALFLSERIVSFQNKKKEY